MRTHKFLSMTLPVWARWARVFLYGGSIIGSGVLLYKYTTPTDEELIARFSPEIRAEYEQGRLLRQKEQAELMKIVKQTSLSNDPIWKTGKIKSPFEKDTRGVDPKLVDIKEFEKEQALVHQQQQVKESVLQLKETESLLNQKSWWKFW